MKTAKPKTALIILTLAMLACVSPVELLGGPTPTKTTVTIQDPAPTGTTMPPAPSPSPEIPTSTAMAAPNTIECAIVNEANVNMRLDPNADANVLTWLKEGQTVTILRRDKWNLVRAGQVVGWVRADLMTSAPCP